MEKISRSVLVWPRRRGKSWRFNLIKGRPPAPFIPVVASSCVAVGLHLSDRGTKELAGGVGVGGGGVDEEHVSEKNSYTSPLLLIVILMEQLKN